MYKKVTCGDVHDNFLGVLWRRVAGVGAAVDGLRLRDDEWRRRHAVALVDHDCAAATPVVRNDLKWLTFSTFCHNQDKNFEILNQSEWD